MFFFSPTGVLRKQGAEALGLGLAGLAGSAISAQSASSNNQQALAFNKWSQLQAQQYQTQMYNQQKIDQENFYKKFQSPEAIAKALSQLGVNPSVALSGGHGVGSAPAAMPSGMSSPALSAPALENTGEHWAKGLTNITSSIAQLSSASKTNAEAQQILQTMPGVVRQYLLDNENKEIANSYDRLMLSIQEKYGDSKAAVELTEGLSRVVVAWSQSDYYEAAEQLQRIQKKIADKEYDMKEIDAANYQTQISYLLKKFKLDNDLLNEKINTEKTQQGLNRSSAANNYSQVNLNRALTKTENALRDGKVSALQLSNDLSMVAKFLQGNELAFSEQTLPARIESFIEGLRQQKLITGQQYYDLMQKRIAANWADRQQYMQYWTGFFNSASNVIGSSSGYYNGTINRMNNNDRIKVQREFNDVINQRNSPAPPVDVQGFEYYTPWSH